MKKRAAIAAAAAAALFAAAALAWFFLRPGSERGESPQDEAVELVYYTIGDPDEDLELVNEAVNELLLERYGFTVDYRKVGWNEYENQLTALINTHSGFDIAFACDPDSDRHGIVTPEGLMNPNHYLSVVVDFLIRDSGVLAVHLHGHDAVQPEGDALLGFDTGFRRFYIDFE